MDACVATTKKAGLLHWSILALLMLILAPGMLAAQRMWVVSVGPVFRIGGDHGSDGRPDILVPHGRIGDRPRVRCAASGLEQLGRRPGRLGPWRMGQRQCGKLWHGLRVRRPRAE